MAIFKGRTQVRYNYSRYGYTRNNGKTWHGGIDLEGLDSAEILMPDFNGKSISGTVTRARIVTNKNNATWEWGYYVCVKLDKAQTSDKVNYLYFCHNSENKVKVGQKVKTGDVLAVMGNTGNAAQASPPYKHCHFEVRATATGKRLDPTAYSGTKNAVGVYGEKPADGTAGSGTESTKNDSGLQIITIGGDSGISKGDVATVTALCEKLDLPYKLKSV